MADHITQSQNESQNPFEQSVEEQVAALRRANEEEGWGIPDEVINRLAETAPEWPSGRLAFRSLRIRFGEGVEGVAKTFEVHVRRIQRQFGARFEMSKKISLGKRKHQGKLIDSLRLLVKNNTHKPTVEWVLIDLDTNRQRESIMAVRDARSLADEILVFAWLFPNYIKSIDYAGNPGVIAAGYGMHSHVKYTNGNLRWPYVPYVGWLRESEKMWVCTRVQDDRDYRYSVPILLG